MDAKKSDVGCQDGPLPNKTAISAAVVLLVITFGGAAARAQRPRPPAGPPPDTSYVAGMPSVDKIKQTIQGSDPTDTLARQVAVFNLMPQIIQQMGLAPGRHFGDTTPQEQGYLNQCAVAAYQMTQDFSKSHTPAEVNAFTTLHNKYETDGPFWQDMLNKLFTTQFLAAYVKVNRDANAAFQAHIDQERKQGQPPPRPVASGNSGGLGTLDPSNVAASSLETSGPTKEQIRCLELGWSKGYCLGGTFEPVFDLARGIGKVISDVMTSGVGANTNTPPPPPPHGLIMSGEYKSANGLDMAFSTGGGLTLSGCGNLIPRPAGLAITPSGNGYILQLIVTPMNLQLAFRPGGQIVGPGEATVNGQVITGYNIVSESRRYGDGTIVPGSVSTSKVPVYGPATATCEFGAFQLIPQTYPAQSDGAAKEYGTNDFAGLPVPNGMRMSGIYGAPGAGGSSGPTGAAGALRVQFDVNNVVIDCGQAHVKTQYSVREDGGVVAVTVAYGESPFTLMLKPDGSLSGSGSVHVNGRLLAGGNANSGFTFTPVSATCNVGTLTAI